MEPLEVLQWVVLGLLVPALSTMVVLLTKVRGTQVAILSGIMEMHKWHAPRTHEAITELIKEIRGLRGDFKDVIPKLQEEHRVQDRAMAVILKSGEAIEKKVTEITTTLHQGGGPR